MVNGSWFMVNGQWYIKKSQRLITRGWLTLKIKVMNDLKIFLLVASLEI